MVSPAVTRPLPSLSTTPPACLSTLSPGSCEVGVLVVSGAEVTAGPVGGVPDAVAVLSTEPPSTSAWMTV